MKYFLFSTTPEWSAFVLRLILGAVMLPHGMQKVFGSFGGYGYLATMSYFTSTMNLPWLIAFAVVITEFVGAIALMVGFASRFWACGLAAIMIGAIITTNFRNGFFMNWFGTQAGEGYEYHLLVLAICIAIIILGSGRFSIDQMISTK
jgi:putative oxidoreductase